MDRLTDFELEQFEQQLINDGTDIQVRKLIDEVKEHRQLKEVMHKYDIYSAEELEKRLIEYGAI